MTRLKGRNTPNIDLLTNFILITPEYQYINTKTMRDFSNNTISCDDYRVPVAPLTLSEF